MAIKQMSFRCTEELHTDTARLASELAMSKSEILRLAVLRYVRDTQAEMAKQTVREPVVMENVALSELAVTVVSQYVDEPVYMAVPNKEHAPEEVAPSMEHAPEVGDDDMMELLIASGLIQKDAMVNQFYVLLSDISSYTTLVKKYRYGFINPKSTKMSTPKLIEAKKDADNRLCMALSTLIAMTVPQNQVVELIEAVFLNAPALPETMAKNLIKQVRAKYNRDLLKSVAKGLTDRGHVLDKLNQIVIALNSEPC